MLARDAVEVPVEDTGEAALGTEEDEGVGERDEPGGDGGDGVVALVAGLGVVVEDEGLGEVSVFGQRGYGGLTTP
jgi:hypothetical protein